jgi:hypothetical protein
MSKTKLFYGLMVAIALLLPTMALSIGDAGNSLSYNATTKVVSVADDPKLDSLNQVYTLEAWFNATTLPAGNYPRIFERDGVFALYLNTTTMQFEWKSETLPSAPVITSGVITTGAWHHIAVRRKQEMSNYLTSIFIDGVASGTTSTSADFALSAGTAPLVIGNRAALDRCWNGLVDEVRIWNLDRSDALIKTQRGQVLTGAQMHLLAYYKLDEGTGQVASDATANALDAAIGSDPLNVDGDDPAWGVSNAPVGFNLLTPNGGAFTIADPLTVTWSVDPEIANVNVQLSVDGGTTWMYIAFNTANDGNFSTFVPGFPTTTAVFRVTNPSDVTMFDDSDAPIAFNSVGSWKKTVTKEAEDAVITKPMRTNWDGHAYDCTFIYTSQNLEGTADITVNIATDGLYKLWGRVKAKGGTRNSFFVQVDGGMNYIWDTLKKDDWIWETISHRGATGIPNVTAEIDPILLNLTAGNHTVRISGRENYTRLDQIRLTNDLTASYSDGPDAWVELVNPPDGEDGGIVVRNTDYEITWKSQNISDEVTIELSKEDRFFTNPILIVRGTDNDGSFIWHVPDDSVDDAFIRISDGDGEGCPMDQTWDAFSIISPPPVITVTAPNGGEEWQANTTHNITWTSAYYAGTVDLALSIDNGKTWSTIATIKPATGTYAWLVPNTPSDSCLIRAFDSADGIPADTSDMVFAIVAPPQPGQDFALSFDGVNDLVEVANHSSLNVSNKFTIEFWFKTSNPAQNYSRIIEKGSWDEYYVGFYGTTGKMSGGLRVTSGGTSRMDIPVGPSTTAMAANKWYHFAATYDGVSAKLYVNGILESTKPATAAPRNLLGNLIIGAVKRVGFSERFLNGLLDELSIWNVALTVTEIKAAMYDSLVGNETGLVAYYRFNEGAGQVAGDLTANNNDGRLGTTTGADATDPTWVLSDRPVSPFLMAGPASQANEAEVKIATLPDQFELAQNYPNPFNAGTTIIFSIPPTSEETVNVTLTIYDIKGQVIRSLVSGNAEPGQHQILWNGTTDAGNLAASGIYFYRINAGKFSDTKRMVMLK